MNASMSDTGPLCNVGKHDTKPIGARLCPHSFIVHVPKLPFGATQEHGGEQLQNMTKGVIDCKWKWVPFHETDEEAKRHEPNEPAQPKTRGKSYQTLLEGQRWTVI